MLQLETNNGQQLQGGVLGLAATVMLTNVGADGQADWQPVDPGITEPDHAAHEKPSLRL